MKMARKIIKFSQIFLFIFLLVFLPNCAGNAGSSKQILIDNEKNPVKINVEIADDSEEITKGLMFRKHLDDNNGMLFIFDIHRGSSKFCDIAFKFNSTHKIGEPLP